MGADLAASPLDLVRHVGAGLAMALGLLGVLAGALGVLRFGDFYTRLQAAALIPALGAMLVLVGLGIEAWDARFTTRLLIAGALIAAAGPIALYALANAAHAAGHAPHIGDGRGGRR